jgi:phage shock protein C
MFCTQCGIKLDDTSFYCSQCGKATENAPRLSSLGPKKRLSRPREGTKIAGVCTGFARHLDVDVTLVRVIWLVLIFWPPCVGIIAYIVCWAVMPKDPAPLAATFDTVRST